MVVTGGRGMVATEAMRRLVLLGDEMVRRGGMWERERQAEVRLEGLQQPELPEVQRDIWCRELRRASRGTSIFPWRGGDWERNRRRRSDLQSRPENGLARRLV
jgi:hypothetical protein